MQHLETALLDAERRHLFGKNKPLEVKGFRSKLLKRSSKIGEGEVHQLSQVQNMKFTKIGLEGKLLLSKMPSVAVQLFPTQISVL